MYGNLVLQTAVGEDTDWSWKHAVAELNVCFRVTMEDGAFLLKSLLLKNITSEDFKSTFTCVVTNTAGTTHKYTTLTQTSNCYVRKVKKNIACK